MWEYMHKLNKLSYADLPRKIIGLHSDGSGFFCFKKAF